MSVFSKTAKDKASADNKPAYIAKAVGLVFDVVYYAMIVCILLAVIIGIIMLLVKIHDENTLYPPFMKFQDDTYYVTVGNGVKIVCPADTIKSAELPGKIKTMIYAQIMTVIFSCIIIAPISRFASKIAKKMSRGEHDLVVAKNMKFIGLWVLVGSFVLRLVDNIYNCLLIKAFVPSPQNIRFSFSIPLGGIAVGLIIIIFASLYADVCSKKSSTDVVKAESDGDKPEEQAGEEE